MQNWEKQDKGLAVGQPTALDSCSLPLSASMLVHKDARAARLIPIMLDALADLLNAHS